MSTLFKIRESIYNTKYFQVLSDENRRTVTHGWETKCYKSLSLWKNYYQNINLQTCWRFQNKIKETERRKMSLKIM